MVYIGYHVIKRLQRMSREILVWTMVRLIQLNPPCSRVDKKGDGRRKRWRKNTMCKQSWSIRANYKELRWDQRWPCFGAIIRDDVWLVRWGIWFLQPEGQADYAQSTGNMNYKSRGRQEGCNPYDLPLGLFVGANNHFRSLSLVMSCSETSRDKVLSGSHIFSGWWFTEAFLQVVLFCYVGINPWNDPCK